MNNLTPFHVAVPVVDLEEARTFYREVLGCTEGRSDEKWVDFNLYGHQFVIHHKNGEKTEHVRNNVDGHNVPVPHYGVVLEWNVWQQLADKMKGKGIDFVVDPYVRFEGQVGEQATMFFMDPSGNALEFKAFKNMNQLFAS